MSIYGDVHDRIPQIKALYIRELNSTSSRMQTLDADAFIWCLELGV